MHARSGALKAFSPLLLGFLLLGCGRRPAGEASPAQTGAALTHVKLALNWVPEPEFGGFYAAREDGAYRRHGIDVEIQGGGAGVPVLQMVATGRADFGIASGDGVVEARARGADVVAVFATFQTSPQGIMVHASRRLARLQDAFQSGTLGLETGLAYVQFLKAKFPWGAVKIVPYDGGVARFLADPEFGQQCYVTSEPIAARRQGGDPQVFLIADAGFDPYNTVVITRRELLDRHPELARAFVAASRQGWRRYLDDPGPTNALLGRLTPALDAEALAGAAAAQKPLVETAETRALGLGAMTRERWQALAAQLVELKLVSGGPAAPDVDSLFVAPPAP